MFFDKYVHGLLYYAQFQGLPGFLLNMAPERFFQYMALNVPYKEQVFEDISREPVHIIKHGGDCGEKTKCNMIYFQRNKIPYKIVFLKIREDKYHVFCQALINGDYTDFDNSYNYLKLGERFKFDEIKVYKIQ